jgi:16S rRNA (uracil1498-N3)-methyltransferase
MNNSHVFSIYVKSISLLLAGIKEQHIFVFNDKELHKRLIRVLRLKVKESVILFDKQVHVVCSLQAKTFEQNKKVFVYILKIEKNKSFVPEIVLCPSLLKKNSFEYVVYMAAEMGVQTIRPVLSEKVKRSWGGDRERDRLEKIIISACEQSKNFSIPELCEPILLSDLVTMDADGIRVVFDVGGKPLFNLLRSLHENTTKKIFLLFGPEGGFTQEETDFVIKSNFFYYNLTPTVLRAVEAVAVGLGSVRSVGF